MPIYYSLSKNQNISLFDSEFDAVFSNCPEQDSVNDYIKIFTGKHCNLPECYSNMLKELSIDANSSSCYLPKYKLQKYLTDVRQKISECKISDSGFSYLRTLVKQKKFLSSLQQPIVDTLRLNQLINEQSYDGQKQNLVKFNPCKNSGFANKVIYSTSGTTTGRLVVTDGPNILVAPSQVRKCFKSRFKNGKIIQIDLVAAEPKFALHFMNKNIPVDVYDDISNKVFRNKLKRHQVKIATICALYGQSPRRLEEHLGGLIDARTAVANVKSYFSHDLLLQKIRENSTSSMMKNYFGRPIKIDKNSPAISYFLQSSVAEASILMFSDICKRHSSIVPLYVVHDALIADVSADIYRELSAKKVFNLTLDGWDFASKISELG